jgi:AcrR family transcriptional regulator
MRRATLSTGAITARAADLADDMGFEAMTLSAVARSLGVQTPSLYSHVRDLAALRSDVTALALSDLAARIASNIAGRSERQALDGLADAYREFAHQHPGRWQALQRRADPGAVRSTGAHSVVELTRAVLLGYRLPDSQHVHAIRFIGSTINGFLSLERIGSFDHSSPDPETSWHRVVDAVDAALRDWPSDPPIHQDADH